MVKKFLLLERERENVTDFSLIWKNEGTVAEYEGTEKVCYV